MNHIIFTILIVLLVSLTVCYFLFALNSKSSKHAPIMQTVHPLLWVGLGGDKCIRDIEFRVLGGALSLACSWQLLPPHSNPSITFLF